MNPQYITLIILLIAIILFITEWVNYTATALFVPIALYLTGVLNISEAVSGLTNSAVLMTAGMLIIGGTILASGMAKKIGNLIIKHIHNERNVMLALMITGALMSAFMSNMGTATVLVPLTVGICQANSNYRLSKLLMGVAVSCTTGGMLTMIGSPVNLVARTTLETNGYGTLGLFEFTKIGLPITIIAIIYMYFIGYKIIPDTKIDVSKMSFSRDTSVISKKNQIITFITFIIVVAMMISEKIINIPIQISAFIGVLILFFTKVINDKQAYSYIEWPAVFLVAGMLPLANAMVKTGAANLIADKIIKLVGNASPIFFTAVLFLIACLLTQFMSNTACATLLLSIGIAIAQELGCSPVNVVMAITIGASCSHATPIATPHNTFIMGYAKYKFMDYVKVGVPLIIACFFISIILIPVFWPY